LPPLYDEAQVKTLFESASKGVVEIRTIVRVGRQIGEGSGAGFFIDDQGHIISNNHVIDGASSISVRLFDGRVVDAKTLGVSPQDDLALLKVDPAEIEGVKFLPLANSADVETGQMAIAIGSPFFEFNSLSVGVVSGIGRSQPSDLGRGSSRPIPNLVQTDAALNPGNSGGPLLNIAGEVIGVNSSVQIQNGVQIGVGFAVPADTVRELIERLKVPGVHLRPWLGFAGDDIDDIFVARTRLTVESGVYVKGVCQNSPAAEGGLQGDPISLLPGNPITGRGDVITGIGGTPVGKMSEFVLAINAYQPGDEIILDIVRNGRAEELGMTLGEWRDNCAYINQ